VIGVTVPLRPICLHGDTTNSPKSFDEVLCDFPATWDTGCTRKTRSNEKRVDTWALMNREREGFERSRVGIWLD
jgi:hypothetical protein